MYTRSYYADPGERINPPEKYDGTFLGNDGAGDDKREDASTVSSNTNPWESQNDCIQKEEEKENAGLFSYFSRLPFLSGFLGERELQSLKIPKIGAEELLIIGAAIFLFFSSNGDRECALFLLFLLLIN